ncbi:MAG: hypothetical protein RLZ26_2129 [Pseudomonadota bacterium]|jgi:hypothetical protein
MRRLMAILAAAGLLGGCAAPFGGPDAAALPGDAAAIGLGLPAEGLPEMRRFADGPAPAPERDNATAARDILDLVFRLETGREVARLTRFEGPVRVTLAGRVPATAEADLGALLRRLRAEAGIDIRRAPPGAQAAEIVVAFVPDRAMRSAVPEAACFVVPSVTGWERFLADPRSAAFDWAQLDRRRGATVFIPEGAAPQDVRDCLHEEIAQALGPLNDLWRLTDSIFNDDNAHVVLTGFDMLVLRAIYDDALTSGLTRAEVAARLPGVLARINPAGGRMAIAPAIPETPAAWRQATGTALAPGTGRAARRAAAERAVGMVGRAGIGPAEAAFSHFLIARGIGATDPVRALGHFAEAAAIWEGLPGGAPYLAQVDMHVAALALQSGEAAVAARLTARAIPRARAAQNAALLANLLMIEAAALAAQGEAQGARARWLDSLGWARYGFGAERLVRDRAESIARLAQGQEQG